MVKRFGDQMEVWLGGQKKDITLSNGQVRGGKCVYWVMGGIGGCQDAQRFQNQGFWLMRMEIPALKDNICC